MPRMHKHYRRRDSRPANASAAHEFNRTFRSPLTAYFTRRVNNRNEAEVLTQEVFFRLLNHPARREGRAVEGYVFTIAVNLLQDREKSVAAGRQCIPERWRANPGNAGASEAIDLLGGKSVETVKYVPALLELQGTAELARLHVARAVQPRKLNLPLAGSAAAVFIILAAAAFFYLNR